MLSDKDFDGNKNRNEKTLALKIEHSASDKYQETPEINSSKKPDFTESATKAPVNLFTPAFKEPDNGYTNSAAKVPEFLDEKSKPFNN